MGCVATQDNGKGESEGYYYGTILYSKTETPWSRFVVGEKLMSVTMHEFRNRAISLG